MAMDAAWWGAESVVSDLGNSYQQILMRGQLSPTNEIASEPERYISPPDVQTDVGMPEQGELFYLNHFPDLDQQAPDLEPER